MAEYIGNVHYYKMTVVFLSFMNYGYIPEYRQILNPQLTLVMQEQED